MADTRGIDRLQEDNENRVFSDNFGGLNTTASDINVPYSDSPLLYNCDVDISGNITKRRGTRIIGNVAAGADRGYGYFNFISGNFHSFVVEKNGLDLIINNISDDGISGGITKSNVFSNAALNSYPSFARTSEFEPRVLVMTGTNKPVQLTFVEQTTISSTIDCDFPDPSGRLANVTSNNSFIFRNNVRFPIVSVTTIPGTVPIIRVTTTAPGIGTDDKCDLVFITWQYWAEALYLKGNELADRTTRENAVASDQNVLIPSGLSQQDIPNDFPVQPESFGYYLYNSDVWDPLGSGTSQYDYIIGQNPANTNEDGWASGNGAVYDSANGGTVIPSPLFATFGTIQAAGTPSELVVIKAFDLKPYFNGGLPLDILNVEVTVDGTPLTVSENTGAAVAGFATAFYLFREDGALTTSVGVPSNREARFIRFDASARIGLNPESDVEIICNDDSSFIGTGGLAGQLGFYQDGYYVPIYGIGVFANYAEGVFPSYVEVFDNRVVLAGFANNPLLVVFSELGDSTIPNQSYRKFQTRITDTLATDAIDYQISGITEDYITGLAIWQRSLFVFTRKTAHRIYGGNQLNGLTNTSIFSNLISNQGLINDRSTAKTEDGILYLSDTGVQRIAFGGEDEDYTTPEISINIRPEFGVTENPNYEAQSFLVYDHAKRKVYLGLPKEGGSTDFCRRLFVFDTFRRTWTEYRTDGDFRLYSMLSYEDQTLGEKLLGTYAGFNNQIQYLRFDDERFLDFIVTSTGLVAPTIPVSHHEVSFTVTVDTYTYYIDEGNEENFFEMIPNDDVNDLYVTLEGIELVKGTDYVKHYYENSVELLSVPIPGQTLIVAKRTPVTDYEVTQAAYEAQIGSSFDTPISDHRPYHVVTDNRFVVQDTDYTVNSGAANQIIFSWVGTPDVNSQHYAGQIYEARYTSPLLTLGNLATLKRGKHIYAYFDNRLGQAQYRLSDINAAANQPNDALIGKYKQRLNANLDIFFENSDRSDIGVDTYSFYSLVYDFHIMDIDPSANQSRLYSLFKEHLLGVGYSYKIGVWSFDESTFTLSAWQVTNRVGAEKYINSLI